MTERSAQEELAKDLLAERAAKAAKEQQARTFAGVGCIVTIAVVVLLAVVSSFVRPSLNQVSRYARDAHVVFEADGFLADSTLEAIQAGNTMRAYQIASRASKVLARSVDSGLNAPPGFSRSGAALSDYRSHAAQAFAAISESLNDPSLANLSRAQAQLEADSAYMERAIHAFESDLAHAPFTKAEKQRLLDRFIHG